MQEILNLKENYFSYNLHLYFVYVIKSDLISTKVSCACSCTYIPFFEKHMKEILNLHEDYFSNTLCIKATKSLVRQHICAALPEPLSLDNLISVPVHLHTYPSLNNT